MSFCPSCQQELDAASIAESRCANCGAALRLPAKRTIEDKRSLRLPKSGGGPSDSSSGPISDESVDIEVVETNHPGATIQFSPVDTDHMFPPEDAAAKSPEKASGPQRKSPTVSERADMTIEFQSPEEQDEAAKAKAARESASTIDSVDQPVPRRTHTFESDRTLDLSGLPPEEVKRLESEWSINLEPGDKQGQTIRQKETVTGFRSSLPVKSRYIREKRKNGGPKPTLASEVPDYELLEIIGEGGMGVVYAAHQSSIARTVAVKMLKPSAKIGEEQRDKFISEAVVTGELDHPNIVPIYDLGANDAGALFYSMKRVKGTPWDKVLSQKSLDDNLSIMLRVADAVAFAHAHGVVHRDLKPENVMLGDYGEVLVMDWGLARITTTFANADAIFQADSLGGTPAYMAPEMARGPVDKIDFRSDIYLLGAILYEIIGGKPPHSGRDVMHCLMNAAQNQIDGIRYEGELKSIALRAMATRQEDRYPSVKEFQEAVRVYQSHSESLVLTAHANLNLGQARESGDYKLFARALYGFQESLNLWDNNHRARTLLAETQRDYAECAFAKSDLDLAESLLDPNNPDQDQLRTKIKVAQVERDARNRRLRRAKQAVAALVAAVVTIITVSLFIVNQQRSKAVAARTEAETQRNIALTAKEQEAEQRKEAVKQKDIADQQRGIAETKRQEADQQRSRAEKQTEIAVEQKGLAEKAKEAEEYEAYVAQIGLAAAKIDENAYEYALDLLNACPPERRNWEWGRLVHLCSLGAGTYAAAGPVDAVAFSPDGRNVASGDRGGELVIRDARTGEKRFARKLAEYVYAVAYSPDGHYLAAGASDHKIRIFDVSDAALAGQDPLVKTLEGHADGVLGVEFSPDGRQLLSASYDNTAKLWDIASGRELQNFNGHSWWVWNARFSPDATRIVTASQDGKAIVWQRPKSKEQGAGKQDNGSSPRSPLPAPSYSKLTEFTGHDGAVYAAAFSPDGKSIATGGYDKLVMVWNPDEVQPVDIEARLAGKPDPKINYLRLVGHDGPVRSVGFSPNGKTLASGGDDNAIRLWDVKTGGAVKAIRGHGSAVRSCMFSPDGKYLVSGSQDERVRLWDVSGYEEVRVLHATVLAGHADAVLSARFSHDGREIVTASRDRTANLWDVASGKPIQHFEEGHEFLATSAAFFADGRYLATGAGDNTVRIWDVALGTQVAVLEPTGRLGTLGISPDGAWIVTGSPTSDAKLWDAKTGKETATLAGHKSDVSAVAFAPQGETLATGDDRGDIRLWQRQSGSSDWRTVHELRGHSRSITGLRFTPDGKRLLSSSGDRSCGQWDVATGTELRQLVLKHPEYVSSIDVSPDGTTAITTCDDGIARQWQLADAKLLRSATAPSPKAAFTSVSYSPDGKQALLTSSNDRTVKLWKLDAAIGATGSASADAAEMVLDFNRIGGVVWSAAFARHGAHILTIGGNDAQLWSLATRRPVIRYSPHGAVAAATISPDGKLVATGSWDHSAKIWDADPKSSNFGHAIRKLDGAHDGYVNSVEFSPDGAELLTASDDGTARLWDVATGKPTHEPLASHRGRVVDATYSPDGQLILTVGADKTARIWDRKTGQSRPPLTGHAWSVLCGTFSPDGSLIVTGSEDNTAKIWDVATGREVRPLPGHTAAVTSVAFSPDGSRILTGSRDNTVKLWDAQTGKEILSLSGHEQEVTSVGFSPDGRYVLSSSRDGTAIVWLAVDWHDNKALHTALNQ